MAAKTITVVKTRRGKEYEYTGTVEELVTNTFGYTLDCGHGWNAKINRFPKTAASLISSLNKSVTETMGSCYDPDYYELKK